MVEMRANGLPLEYVVGCTDFCGLRIEVDQGVFVPRKRTEFLVRQAEALSCSGDIVVDLCCGSGAVGVALATALGRVVLYSVDIDPVAVRCAERNVTIFDGHVFEGDLYKALPGLGIKMRKTYAKQNSTSKKPSFPTLRKFGFLIIQ